MPVNTKYRKGRPQSVVAGELQPILDSAGKPLHVVKYATDITEQVGFASQLRTAAKCATWQAEAPWPPRKSSH
jgi:hypothetical protein